MIYVISFYICGMENKIKIGRRRVDPAQKKMPVTIWVRAKHVSKAKNECLKVQTKYEKIL